MKIEEYLSSKTPEELAELVQKSELNLLRQQRDELLSATDWWAVSDRIMTENQITYRQALRDITNHYASPLGVVWPVKPETSE
jgi:hypothetical protein